MHVHRVYAHLFNKLLCVYCRIQHSIVSKCSTACETAVSLASFVLDNVTFYDIG